MFGHDLECARQLNRTVLPTFDESNIYRIDHYLGKETVQNILLFRFGNALFEPVWNRNYVDYVEITAAENVGVENRASFYEKTGALRDMVENHMLQLVALTAMEPPIAFGRVPDRQAAVLSSLFPMSTFVLHFHTERNQQVPTAEKIVSSILSNQSRFRPYAFVLPLVGGLLFSGLGYFMGRTHLRLVLKGARAQGTIVDYRAETFTTTRSGGTTSTSTGYMPVVEYSALGDRKVRFQDWLGTSVAGNRNQVIEVLYDPQNPSVAMIDRPIWNWIPWAPIIVLGVLLILSGIRRALHSLFGSPS